MKPTFENCIEIILGFEGGYNNDPSDLGGETNFGIAKRFYPALDIKGLTKAKAIEIYRSDYWQKNDIEEYPEVIRLQMFDMCVNMGSKGAISVLQATLNKMGYNLTVDGQIGPKTLQAAELSASSEYTKIVLPHFLAMERLNYYIHLAVCRPAQLKFLNGWAKRTTKVLLADTQA